MKIYPSIQSHIPPYIPDALRQIYGYLRDIVKIRQEDIVEFESLNTKFVQGRLRTDRTVPTSAADIQEPDRLGDIVRNEAYEYIVVTDGADFFWARHALDTGW